MEIRRSLDPFLLISQPPLLDFSFSPVFLEEEGEEVGVEPRKRSTRMSRRGGDPSSSSPLLEEEGEEEKGGREEERGGGASDGEKSLLPSLLVPPPLPLLPLRLLPLLRQASVRTGELLQRGGRGL